MLNVQVYFLLYPLCSQELLLHAGQEMVMQIQGEKMTIYSQAHKPGISEQ